MFTLLDELFQSHFLPIRRNSFTNQTLSWLFIYSQRHSIRYFVAWSCDNRRLRRRRCLVALLIYWHYQLFHGTTFIIDFSNLYLLLFPKNDTLHQFFILSLLNVLELLSNLFCSIYLSLFNILFNILFKIQFSIISADLR